MLKSIVFLLSLAASTAFAATPKAVQAGSVVNSWIQGGLRVTDQLMDFGIQGRGFFALQMPNGESVFTRHGAFYLDKEGYLSHKTLGGHLLVVSLNAPNATEPLRLADVMIRPKATLKGLRVILDGTIEGVYSDGYVIKLAVVKLALFQNARKLQRATGEHALYATEASGEAFFDFPQTEMFGSVYAASLEEVDSIYELSLD